MTTNMNEAKALADDAQTVLQSNPEGALSLLVKAITISDTQGMQIEQSPLCDWVILADRLAKQILVHSVDELSVVDGIDSVNQSIDILYNSDSENCTGNSKQALQVCLARVFFMRLMLANNTDDTAVAELEITLSFPFKHAVMAAYLCEHYQNCFALAQQGLSMVAQADLSLWQTIDPNIHLYIDHFEYFMYNFACDALTQMADYEQALHYFEQYRQINFLTYDHSSVITMKVDKSQALLGLNRVNEAQNLLKMLQKDDNASSQQLTRIASILLQIDFINNGDPRDGFKIIFSGLTEQEFEQYCAIIECEMTGILSNKQKQQKQAFTKLAFSEARIKQTVTRTGNELLGRELRKYKKNNVPPEVILAKGQTIQACLDAHDKAVISCTWDEAARTLRAAGIMLFTRHEQNQPIAVQDLARCIDATIATNQVSEFLTQSDVLAVLLMQANAHTLKPLSSRLQQFFRQLIRLVGHDVSNASAQQQRSLKAMRKPTTDNLLVLLAELAFKLPVADAFWFRCIGQLKSFWDFNGLNTQLQQQLYNYPQVIPQHDIAKVNQLSEQLTTIPVRPEQREQFDQRHDQLLTLLLPLRTQSTRQSLGSIDVAHNELILLDIGIKAEQDEKMMVSFSIYGFDKRWKRSLYSNPMPQHKVETFVDNLLPKSISKNRPMEQQLNTIEQLSNDFTNRILSRPLLINPPVCLGVRTTGILQQIPLEALVIKAPIPRLTSNIWFGELTTTALLTGEGSQISWVEKPLKLTSLTIIADPIFDRPFNRLTGSAKEADDIKALFTEKNIPITLLLQEQANRNDFLALSGMAAPQILHIATHGYSDPYKSEYSSLALSKVDKKGNKVTSSIGFFDICLMDLTKTELVILSACSTHHGKPIQGECVSSIAWAFKAAGVKAVIGTRWKVHDKASAEFWSVFYSHLSEGNVIAASLTKARSALIHSTKWSHPAYWASYQLIV